MSLFVNWTPDSILLLIISKVVVIESKALRKPVATNIIAGTDGKIAIRVEIFIGGISPGSALVCSRILSHYSRR